MNRPRGIEVGYIELPLPEYSPPAHPHVVFRAHSMEGPHSILYLGGGEYWVHGIWLVQVENRMVVLRNRVFQVNELAISPASVDMGIAAPYFRPTIG